MFFDLYDEDTGLTDSLRSGRRRGTSGAPWNRLSTPQMENQLVEVCRQLDIRVPEQAIEVPKISSSSRHCGAVCASLSRRQNSWWKCRRSSPILLCCSGLWSRTSIFQFLVVEGETSVFTVFLPDRVQQRSLLLRNAVLSGLWSRSLILAWLVAAFKIFAQYRVPQRLLRFLLDTLVKGFFSDFSQSKKKCEGGSALGVGTECGLQFIHAGGSAGLAAPSRGLLGGRCWWCCPVAGGTFCAASQKCTRTIQGCDVEFGCFYLVLEASVCWRVRLSGPPSYIEAKAAACAG